MTHLYDTVEPNVLSQELLRSCVLAQGPDGEAGRLAQEEGIAFSEVRKLRLDFQSTPVGVGGASCYGILTTRASADILRIENLWQFSNLVKLQLDNNIIEKIEGLDTLVHLEWLGGEPEQLPPLSLPPFLVLLLHIILHLPFSLSPQTYHSTTLRR